MRTLAFVLALIAIPAGAVTPEQQAALNEITAFTAARQKADPLYDVVEKELLPQVDDIIKTRPTAEWAPTLKRLYFAAAERAHSAERERIAVEERAALAKLPGSPDDRWTARMQALEADLLAGQYTPREHALHAREAAAATFPGDQVLLGLRDTKVSLATDYELGNITKAQYDERWSRARTAAQGDMAARDRAVAFQALQVEQATATRDAMMWQGVADRMRAQRGITCTPYLNSVRCR